MKHIFFFIFILFHEDADCMSADTTIPGPLQKVNIDLEDGSFKKGFIKYSTDSSAFFSRTKSSNGYYIPIDQIQAISFRKRTNLARNALIGTGAGLLLGLFLGVNGDCDEDNESSEDCSLIEVLFRRKTFRGALFQGLAFGVAGFIAGLSTRGATLRFLIKKNRREFQEFRYSSY
jgi:hypothetical protein